MCSSVLFVFLQCSNVSAHQELCFQVFVSYCVVFFAYCIYQQCISIEYAPQPQVEYIQQASGTSSGIMCSTDIPDCGLLHDKLSLMWGDYKDKIDELTMEVNKKA